MGSKSVALLELAEAAEEEEGLEGLVRFEFEGHHEGGVARINNGSFGSCPASVQAAQLRWASLWLRQPDRFYFGPLQDAIQNSRHAVASLINAHHIDQVVLLDNVTVAVAMVLQHIAWGFSEGRYQKGDAVLALNFSYGSVKKALRAYLVRAGAHLIQVRLPFPVSSEEEILAAFHSTLKQAQAESWRIRFALIDHITSMPSIVLPIQKLVSLCRRVGIDQVFVDGAHAIGNVGIDVQEIDADYYTSNLHKWLFNPPSVAFLHCKRDRLQDLHHPIVAHHYQEGLGKECGWVGTRDYSAQLAVVDAIQFFRKFKGGLQAVQDYNHCNVVSMGMMLATAWGTHCGTPGDLSSSMIMVGLPNSLGVHCHDDALALRTRLREEFGVEVPVYYAMDPELSGADSCYQQGMAPLAAYVRISYQIYNSLRDYEKLRDAVNFLAVAAGNA
eukprot:c24702_g2_i1 orf=839-2167(-)